MKKLNFYAGPSMSEYHVVFANNYQSSIVNCQFNHLSIVH